MSFGFGMKFQNLLLAKAGYSNIVSADGTLAPFVTFTRSTTGTRYNSAGLLESVAINGPRFDYDPSTVTLANLLRYSQEFDNGAWSKGTGASVGSTAMQAPDGTFTADVIQFTSGGATEFVRQFPQMSIGVTYTVSVYAMLLSGTPTFIFDIGNNAGLASGTKTPTLAWQRFSHTFTFSGANSWIDFEASAGGSIIFWGAQLETGSSATAYIPTTASPAGNAALRGLLIEEQRTNLLTNSSDFTNAAWSSSALSVTSNTIVAPDGTLTADTITADGTSASHTTLQVNAAGTARTFSIFAKAGTNNFIQLFFDADATPWANFNLSTGAVGSVGGSQVVTIQNAGSGWYRCSVYTSSITASNPRIAIITSETSVRAESNTLTTSVFVWGAQLEAGAGSTSYIPTTTASVTRTQDDALISSASSIGFNQSEGTVFVESISPFGGLTAASSFSFVGAGANGFNMGGAGTSRWWNGTSNVATVNFTTGNRKEAFSFTASGGRSICLNGGAIATDSAVPWQTPSPTGARIGAANGIAGNQLINGAIKSVQYYPRRLTDTQLQQMTT